MAQQAQQSSSIFDQNKDREEVDIYDPSCLKLLIKLIDHLRINDNDIWQLFLMQERLIFTSSYLLEKKVDVSDLGFNFTDQIISFVQNINLKIMEATTTMKFEDQIQLISRPVDMLLYKPVYMNIQPFSKVLELRVLTFNNLSCIYKSQNMSQDALKAVDKAIEMENMLVAEGNLEAIKNSPSTFINKAVILSEIGQHLESIETLKKALDAMEKFQKQSEQFVDKDELEQMKYLSVIAYFNLAVEHEHLYYTQYAKAFYETALKYSRELEYGEMTRTIENVLKKMGDVKK